MKRITICLVAVLVIVSNVNAQRFEHQLETSLSKATAENKAVMMIFSGSDWCKPCMELRSNILESEDFVAFSKQSLILLELDFPYRSKNKLSKEQTAHNEALAERYNPDGVFPRVVVFDQQQQVLGQVEYRKNMTDAVFIAQVEALLN